MLHIPTVWYFDKPGQLWNTGQLCIFAKRVLPSLNHMAVSYSQCPSKVKVFYKVSSNTDKNKKVFPESFIELVGTEITGRQNQFSVCVQNMYNTKNCCSSATVMNLATVMNFDCWYAVPRCNFVNKNLKKSINLEALCPVWGFKVTSANGGEMGQLWNGRIKFILLCNTYSVFNFHYEYHSPNL